jgi:hypothetical protein
MRLFRRGSEGQAAVESALTIPMMVFTMLGIVQLTVAYHARALAEYAAFKAARSGSVYRVDCKHMNHAALVALAPSMSFTLSTKPSVESLYTTSVAYASSNTTMWKSTAGSMVGGSKMVWIDYKLEHVDHDFDKQLDPGVEDVPRIRVRMAYFFHYRIPFANWVMVRYWLATQGLLANWGQNDQSDSTIMVVKADKPAVNKVADNTGDLNSATDAMVNQVRLNMLMGVYTLPIVTTWSMRMFSDPLDEFKNLSGDWKCKNY